MIDFVKEILKALGRGLFAVMIPIGMVIGGAALIGTADEHATSVFDLQATFEEDEVLPTGLETVDEDDDVLAFGLDQQTVQVGSGNFRGGSSLPALTNVVG